MMVHMIGAAVGGDPVTMISPWLELCPSAKFLYPDHFTLPVFHSLPIRESISWHPLTFLFLTGLKWTTCSPPKKKLPAWKLTYRTSSVTAMSSPSMFGHLTKSVEFGTTQIEIKYQCFQYSNHLTQSFVCCMDSVYNEHLIESSVIILLDIFL